MIRKIIILCLTVCVLLSCVCTAFAEEFDPDQTGSISVTLIEQKQNTPIVGAQLSLYYVASVVQDDMGKLIYDYTKDFQAIDVPLNDEALTTKLDSFVSQNTVPAATMTTNADGMAQCDQLPLGLYFVKQTNAVDGFAPCTSFLVNIPQEKDGAYIYQVNASPKTQVARLTAITIKKVWNTDKATEAADSVTVQLLRHGTVVKTATLNAQNNWQVTFPDMPESDGYSIQEVGIPKGFTATYRKSGYTFTVTNTPTLVQTGQLTWPIPVLVVSGLLFLALGVALLLKKRKPNG